MAGGAIGAELGLQVVGIGSGIVIGLVATDTGVGRIIIVSVVAGGTIVGDDGVCAVEGIEIIVDIEGSRHPVRIGGMAGGTIVGQVEGLVVGVGSRIEVLLMTAGTLVGCVVIIPVVAFCTIGCNGLMGSGEREEVIMYIKGCRFPSRIGGVAGGTVGRQVEALMVGIGCCNEVIVMAVVANGAGTLVAIDVAIETGCAEVGAGQREGCGVVIETFFGGTGRVAGEAGLVVVVITSDAYVFVIGFRIDMAVGTRDFSVIGRIGVAIQALCPFALVFTGIDGEVLGIVIKGGRRPC